MKSKVVMHLQLLAAAIAVSACAGCSSVPYAMVDDPSAQFASLSPTQLAEATARQAKLERELEEDMKHE
jgi:outer membrane murein-binding lipoprotein Lpp